MTQLSYISTNSSESKNGYFSCSYRFPKSVCIAKSGCHWKQNTCYGYFKNNAENSDKTLLTTQKTGRSHIKTHKKVIYDPCGLVNAGISNLFSETQFLDDIKMSEMPEFSNFVKKCKVSSKCYWNNETQKCERLFPKRV